MNIDRSHVVEPAASVALLGVVMMISNHTKSVLTTAVSFLLAAALSFMPAQAANFKQIASGGLGDAENNYPHSMAHLDKCLFVGASRSWPYRLGILLGTGIGGGGLTSPVNPAVPLEQAAGIPPAPGGGNFSLAQRQAWADDMAAKIFRYCKTGRNRGWTEVYQSRVKQLPNGTFWPVVHGYRWALTFDPPGRGAKYAPAAYFGGGFGFDAESGGLAGDPSKFVSIGNVMVRTYDGEHFEEVATPFGMGADTSMMVDFGGRLCVSSSLSGLGAVIHCAKKGHPENADDWELVSALSGAGPGFNSGIFSIEVFDGHLWAGTSNQAGWQLWKCNASPVQINPLCWELQVAYGGGDLANGTPADLEVFKHHLYVGNFNLPVGITDLSQLKAAEIYRVNKHGDCQLVVGDTDPIFPPPQNADPNLLCDRNALSGLPGGYGNPLNIYTTALRSYNGMLLAGSLDGASFLGLLGDLGDLEESPVTEDLLSEMTDGGEIDLEIILPILFELAGFDLWASYDGEHFFPLELKGLGNPNNFWLRTIYPMGNTLYVGGANAADGFEVFRARNYYPLLITLNSSISTMTRALLDLGLIDSRQANDVWVNAGPN